MIRSLNSLMHRWLGYRLTRDRYGRFDALKDEIGAFDLLLSSGIKLDLTRTIVQVGANDGAALDPITKLLDSSSAPANLVEPMPGAFAKLKELRAARPNTRLFNAAIGERDGIKELWTIDHPDPAKTMELSKLASFDKQTVAAARRKGRLGGVLRSTPVEVLTVEGLCREFGNAPIELLQVDTEGFDAKIVNWFLDTGQRPRLINYEHRHLTAQEDAPLVARLRSLGYKLMRYGWDTAAVVKD